MRRWELYLFHSQPRTLHEGFVDDYAERYVSLPIIRFSTVSMSTISSQTRLCQGKMALTMKELREMEPGDFLVHVDFGIGKFAGLVRVPAGDSYQEMIRACLSA